MGLFSKTINLSADEIINRMNAIDKMIVAKDYDNAISEAKALEKEAPNYAAYHLGMCYHLGYGVEENPDRALSYYSSATSIDNHFLKSVWYMGGLLLFTAKEDYDQAIKWFENAEQLGEKDAGLFLALSYYKMAMQFRGYATKTLKLDEMTQANAVAVKYARLSQNKYLAIADSNADSITPSHWVCLGWCTQLLYNLACRGELSTNIVDDNSLTTWIGNSFKLVGGTMNEDLHAKFLAEAAYIFSVMDKCGWEIISEYFRASCGLLDSELHKSAKAFYRVRWHMKRIGELRSKVGPSVAAELERYMIDVNQRYEKMDKKYGSYVISFAQAGELPDLTPSYLEGQAPSPESCESFMQMYQEIRSMPVSSASEKSSTLKTFLTKGLIGVLKERKK